MLFSEHHRITYLDKGSWLLGNINQTGYFRVNYDLRNWRLLIDQLIRNHEVHSRFAYQIPFLIYEYLPFLILIYHIIFSNWPQVLSVSNRAGLIDDAFSLARYVFLWISPIKTRACKTSSIKLHSMYMSFIQDIKKIYFYLMFFDFGYEF